MHQDFEYSRPSTLAEALAILAEGNGASVAIAGGTDLLVDLRAGLKKPRTLVDIKAIEELRSLGYDDATGLSIGACVTVNELIEHPAVKDHYPLLHTAGSELATHALRNRATVAGNLVTASPCGDMASPLLCLDAAVEITGPSGPRTIPLSQFIEGVKKTVLRSDELVTRILVPPKYRDAAAGYHKLKRIKGHDLGVVAVALLRSNGTMRVAVSSAAPTPVLLPDFPGDSAVEAVQKAAQEAISPIDDVRCTREYRAFMVGVFIERLMAEVRR